MDTEKKFIEIETEIKKLKERNLRVEAQKAWETSSTRTFFIMAITYVLATLVLYSIGNSQPLRNALIPMLGFFLSTQSLPLIKKWWIKRYLSKP